MPKRGGRAVGMAFREFDAAEFIDTPEAVVDYLNVVAEENGLAALYEALGTVARSEGMSRIAERTGLSRESLYKALSASGNPSFATVNKVLRACGLRLEIAIDNVRETSRGLAIV